MIRFFLLQNRAGKTRLAKYYSPFSDEEKIRMEDEIHRLLVARDSKFTSFLEVSKRVFRHVNHFHSTHPHSMHAYIAQYKTFKLVHRRYAGLHFVLCVDVSDNELLYMETIHLFVEILDHYFSNVCELDLVFGFHKVYCILDEFIIGGEVQETSKKVILERLRELNALET